MNGQMDVITLISLIIAIVAIMKLRSVLGQRTEDDDARVERLKTRAREAADARGETPGGEVISLPRKASDGVPVAAEAVPASGMAESRIRAYSAEPAVTEGLLEIGKHDPAFEPEPFVHGAKQAYEMIVSAFADGDRKTLKDLLSRDVFEGFTAAISDRESRGETIDQQFVGIKKADIAGAEVAGGMASITMRFVSELITATRDKAGAIIGGDDQRITEVTDVWTFSRDVSNKRALANPNWKLVETQPPN